MLTPEQVQDRLNACQNPNYRDEQLKRVRSLKGNLSSIGQILIQAGPSWQQVSSSQEKTRLARIDAFDQLGRLKPGELHKLFNAFFPRLAPQVQAAWNLFDILPYQTTHERRPFRKPNFYSPEARTVWLQRLLFATRDYDQDVTWFAAWAPYLGYDEPDALGYLFAGAIEAGGKTGQEVFDILIASANGSHEIGIMGRHVVRGLLCASRQDGWRMIEQMLIAAQREEGLRQVILESTDEAQPEAFRRLLHLILDHNLTRFSAAIRAFNVWFGLALETVHQKTVIDLLSSVLGYIENPELRESALQEGTAQERYFALWASAFNDAEAILPRAIALRQSSDTDCRFAAVHLLAQMELFGSFQELVRALDDPNLSVAVRAFIGLNRCIYRNEVVNKSDLFERLEHLITRLPHKENDLRSLVWDWLPQRITQAQITGCMLEYLGDRSPKRLFPYLSIMSRDDRAKLPGLLKEIARDDQEARQVLLDLAADPSPYVRKSAFDAIGVSHLTAKETLYLEHLLTRQAEDLRQSIIRILLNLPDDAMLQSAKRLLEQKNERQRRAGLEMLRESIQINRCARQCRALADDFEKRFTPQGSENQILEDILAKEVEQVTLEDALGLMNPQNRTRPAPPTSDARLFGFRRKVIMGSDAALALLQSLDDLVEQHRTHPVELTFWNTNRTELLGNVRYGFPIPDPSQPLEQDLARLPLKEVWMTWEQERPGTMRDADGCELLRALAILDLFQTHWTGLRFVDADIPADLQEFFNIRCSLTLNYKSILTPVLQWMIRTFSMQNEVSFLLDALEDSASRIPLNELAEVKELYMGVMSRTIEVQSKKLVYLHLCRWHRSLKLEVWKDEHHARLWAVVRWLDEPRADLPRSRPHLEDILFAQRAGAATRDDLLDLLLGPRQTGGYGIAFHPLWELSGRKPHPFFNQFPDLKNLVNACRERILSIEIRRGDLPTAATLPAGALRSVPGMDHLFRLLVALGKTSFERGDHFSNNRQATLSRLVRVTYPLEGDTHEDFVALVKTYAISERRLIELAVFAPQWSGFVESALGWQRLQEAVYWVHAHTKDRQWSVEKEIRELWAAQISEFTPLSADSLMDGAVDVAWFHLVYEALGDEKWKKVYHAAELTAIGNGHMRARIFADTMLGKVTADQLIDRIAQKRHQDSLRALGLAPLPAGDDRQPEILRRYEVMQEFLRTSKKFGSQRQASEKLAAAIGMENLARTAGYSDPQRLEWAMEIEAVSDLAKGPVEVEVVGTRLFLSINDLGEPKLTVSRNGKTLKAIPAIVKKHEHIASLTERKQKLDRQVSRMRQSLEQAMCRGDTFSRAESQELFQHPMLRTMLEQLIFTGPTGMGYPIENGKALFAHSGQQIPVASQGNLRIAHPVDLLAGGEWHLWQHECFVTERIQPFKQVFRELYILSPAEKEEGILSRRYAGQQVNPRQALALFGARGWVTDPEEGVHKTFHDLGISARVGFLQGAFTPAEVEGLTLEAVVFTRRGEWAPLQLIEIDPRVFSEVMRDLDLVVSVAHAGGVDPEASASSIEAREALIRETCDLLGLRNIRVQDRHALIEGKLGNYTIHLGSAVVHKQPGGSLCIIPVHSQQRGRIFLPFVDNDPKSAEIISKVLLLAKDSEIRDPTILEQIIN